MTTGHHTEPEPERLSELFPKGGRVGKKQAGHTNCNQQLTTPTPTTHRVAMAVSVMNLCLDTRIAFSESFVSLPQIHFH